MAIRAAVAADVPALVAMGARFIALSSYGDLMPTVPAQITAIIGFLIASPDGEVYVATTADGTITGMIGALCFRHVLTAEWVASALFLWVDPAARGLAGGHLIRRFVRWARAHDADKLHLNAPAGTDLGPKYVRIGAVEVETTYQIDLRRGAAA